MREWASYIGIPYAERGRTREGLDCWGLVCLVYIERYHISLPSFGYGATPTEFAAAIARHRGEDWRTVEEPAEGDVVVLRQMGCASHVGVLCDDHTFIHCEEGIGVTRVRLTDPRWSPRIVSYYRHCRLEGVRVVASHSPLSEQREILDVEHGATVAELVARAIPENERHLCRVVVHGQPVPPELWESARPHRGAIITMRVFPRGGGRGLFRSLLTLALFSWIGGAAFGRMLSRWGVESAFARALVRGAITAIGLMLVNAIAPPPLPALDDLGGVGRSTMYSIYGAQNRIAQYGYVPVVLGTHRIYPPHAAKPYTMIRGDDQYLCCLFAIGYGPLSISDLRIGDTSLSSFSDYEVETREGTAGDAAITLFPESVDEQQLNIALTYAAGAQERTTTTNTDEGIVDITFPRGLARYQEEGGVGWRAVAFLLKYRVHPAGGWSNPLGYYVSALTLTTGGSGYAQGVHGLVFTGGGGSGAAGTAWVMGSKITASGGVYRVELTEFGNGYTSAPTISLPPAAGGSGAVITPSMTAGYAFKESSRDPKRFSFLIDFPSRDQYDISCERLSADSTDEKDVDEFFWTALRSVKDEPPVDTPYYLAKVALRVKASGQLNGMLSTFNCLAKSRGHKWNSGTSNWDADQDISNPADIYRLILQHPSNGRALADARIDLTQLAAWSEFCDTKGFTFGCVLDGKGTLRQRLAAIASAGRASQAMRGGKFGVIIDQAQSSPVQIFTPRNSRGFSAMRTFITMPHALKIRFINGDNEYLQEERIVYGDGYNVGNATIFERLDIFGVTDPEQVWKLGRYYLAVMEYQQHQYSIETDFEHLVCTRGDRVEVANTDILVGLAVGRVMAVSADELEVDEICPMELGESYAVQVRIAGVAGSSWTTWNLVTVAGDQKTLVRSGGAAFDCGVGDMFAFGKAGEVTLSVLIRSIEHSGDLEARLSCVPYSADVYSADSGSVPSYSAQQTLPERLRPPTAPQVLTANEFLYLDGGRIKQGISLHWLFPDNQTLDEFEVQVAAPDGPGYVVAGRPTVPQCTLLDQAPGEYSFRVRTVKGLRRSDWIEITDQTIDAYDDAPDDVVGLRLGYRGGSPVLTWTAVDDVRDLEYEVRLIRSGNTWAAGIVVATVAVAEYTPQVTGPYMVKAKFGAAYSAIPAGVFVPFRTLGVENVKETQDEQPAWGGTLSGDVHPNPPLVGHFDAKWYIQKSGFDGTFDVEYEPADDGEPDTAGWTLGGTDYASVVDGILVIENSGICYYYRTVAVTGNQWITVEAKLRVEEGDMASLWAYQHSLGGYGYIVVESDRMTINGSVEILGDFETVARLIRVEQREGTRVYLDGDLVAVVDGLTYTGGTSYVYFGRGATLAAASQQHWSCVYYALDSNTQDTTPDGWAVVGVPSLAACSGLREYGDLGTVTATGDNGWERTPAMAADDVLILQVPIDDLANSAVVGFLMQLSNSASGHGVRFELINNVVYAKDLDSYPYPTLASAVHDTHGEYVVTGILVGDQYWLLMNRDVVLSGTAGGDGAMGDRVRWGTTQTVAGQVCDIAAALFTHDDKLPNGLALMPGDSGGYQIDTGDVVDLGLLAESVVDSEVLATILGIYDLYLVDDLYLEPDLASGTNEYIQAQYAKIQIRVHDGDAYDDWTPLVPGSYYAQKYDLRLVLEAPAADKLHIKSWHWEVDMPDHRELPSVLTGTGGDTTVTWDQPYQTTPAVIGTIQTELAGDRLSITSIGTTGCVVNVYNSGSRVARTVSLMAIGY